MTSNKRKLGLSYSLALKTGGKEKSETHLTLVYFDRLKRGYEQNLVKEIVENYFKKIGISEVEIEFGKPCLKRSIEVKGKLIEKISKDLHIIFNGYNKFNVSEESQCLHIDLKTVNKPTDLLKKVPLFNNWYI